MGEGRAVVAQVWSAKTDRVQAGPVKDVHRPRDGLSLLAMIERRVIAMHKPVQRELNAALGVTPEECRVAVENACRRRPRRPGPGVRHDRVVAIEAPGHRGGCRAEPREHAGRPRGGSRRAS